jgi:cation:H+ antiporter
LELYFTFFLHAFLIILGAFLVSWAAETGQRFVSQGIVLAILAWIQILPEFAVEATLSYTAAKNPAKIALVAANFTGSIRLLIGVGIPLIFLIRVIFLEKRTDIFSYSLKIPQYHGITVLGNFLSLPIFLIIILKKSLSLIDSFLLIGLYLLYLRLVAKTPPADEELEQEMEFVPKIVAKIPSALLRWICIALLFLSGGLIFYKVVHPFVENCEKIAIKIGLSSFVFIQWVAPFLTEFPEKLTVFYWAKNALKAPIGLLNILSANISQWTLLPAMIPIVYFIGCGKTYIIWDHLHLVEIGLTMAQTLFVVTLLFDGKLNLWDSLLIFFLWFAQFVYPTLREEIIFVYIGLTILVILNIIVKKLKPVVIKDCLLLIKK